MTMHFAIGAGRDGGTVGARPGIGGRPGDALSHRKAAKHKCRSCRPYRECGSRRLLGGDTALPQHMRRVYHCRTRLLSPSGSKLLVIPLLRSAAYGFGLPPDTRSAMRPIQEFRMSPRRVDDRTQALDISKSLQEHLSRVPFAVASHAKRRLTDSCI